MGVVAEHIMFKYKTVMCTIVDNQLAALEIPSVNVEKQCEDTKK